MNWNAGQTSKRFLGPVLFSFVLSVILIFPPVSRPLAHAAGGSWELTDAMKDARYNHTATLLPDETVLVVGGQRDSEDFPDCLSGCELYDSAAGSWQAVADLAAVRTSHTATLLRDGRVLVAGGQDRKREVNTAEIYEPGTGAWVQAEPLHQKRLGHTATLLEDGRVLVTGGVDVQWEPLAGTEIYDPATGMWTSAGDMAHPRGWHRATLLSDGRVFVFGGWGGRRPQQTAEIFDPLSESWSEAAPLENRPLYFASQILLPDDGGGVFVAGGYGSGKTWKDVHLYDPERNAWIPGFSAMIEERNSHTATLLPGGSVLLAGGWCLSGYRHGEVFDPVTKSFSPTGPMATPSAHHTATFLPDGTVLLAGGRSPSGSLNRAEIYRPANNPVPDLTKIDPSSTAAGSPGIELAVSGSGFTDLSRVRWNGLDRDTTFVSPEILKAALRAENLAEAGQAEVTVFTPSPGGGTSTGVIFTITKKDKQGPEIGELKPSSALAGGPGFILRVQGVHFTRRSAILWNNREIRTFFLSSRQLAAFVSSREVARPETVTIRVIDRKTGRSPSNAVLFEIYERSREPAVIGLSR